MSRLNIKLRLKLYGLIKLVYSAAFRITGFRWFFEKKVAWGAVLLSLMNILSGCGNSTDKSSTPAGEGNLKGNMKADSVQEGCYKAIDTVQHVSKRQIIEPLISCYDMEVIPAEAPEDTTDTMCYIIMPIEEFPEYPGGQLAMMVFFDSVAVYPKAAYERGIEGTVFVQFTVDSLGQVRLPKVLRGVSYELDAEALRVVGLMPSWKSGKQDGKRISMSYVVPLKFSLDKKVKEIKE